jgi:hypothetical protein
MDVAQIELHDDSEYPYGFDTKFDFSEANICDKLSRKYAGNCKYKLPNAFVFKSDWESDFFVQKQNGYAYEFEVKISRSDFFNDKKKVQKHLILEHGKYSKTGTLSTWDRDTKTYTHQEQVTEHTHDLRPNKFYYVVPENMVTVQEIPSYAGLMYVPTDKFKDIITIKEAPFIHKQKLNFENVLCNKFYHYWLEMKSKVRQLELEIKSLHIHQGLINKEL